MYVQKQNPRKPKPQTLIYIVVSRNSRACIWTPIKKIEKDSQMDIIFRNMDLVFTCVFLLELTGTYEIISYLVQNVCLGYAHIILCLVFTCVLLLGLTGTLDGENIFCKDFLSWLCTYYFVPGLYLFLPPRIDL